jgi:hypothetical protein
MGSFWEGLWGAQLVVFLDLSRGGCSCRSKIQSIQSLIHLFPRPFPGKPNSGALTFHSREQGVTFISSKRKERKQRRKLGRFNSLR